MRRQSVPVQRWVLTIVLASLTCGAPALAQDNGPAAGVAKPSPAVAAPGGAGSEASEKQAAKLFDDGVKEARAGAWEKARVLMLAAFKLKPSAEWAANLGRVELMAGKPRDAMEHLSFFLRDAKGATDDDQKAARSMLADAKAKLAVLTIHVVPAGAEVLVDAISIGRAPLAELLLVDPGTHKIVARVPNRPDALRSVTLKEGASEVISLDVAEFPTAPAPVPILAIEKPKKSRVLLFGGAGLTAAALGAGIAFTVVSNGKASTADGTLAILTGKSNNDIPCESKNYSTDCATLRSTNRSSDTFHSLAVAGYAVAGIAGVGTLAYAFWPSKRTVPQNGLIVLPSPGGIFVSGRF